MVVTTIRVSRSVKEQLDAMKVRPTETYNEVILRLLEDLEEVDEGTKRQIREARKEIDAGRSHTFGQVKRTMGS
jgi:predicted transcriptional regulator